MNERDRQRELEQARGREIAARHAAEIAPQKTAAEKTELLERYKEIRYRQGTDSFGNPVETRRFDIVFDARGNNRATLDGVEIAAERRGPSFPSDMFVANCALAVGALVNPADVPDYSKARKHQIEERKRRDEYKRATVGQWKQAYDKP